MRFLVMMLLTLTAADVAAEVCEYDAECDANEICVDGECVDETDVICGKDDRQCRIRILKRRNEARRLERMIREERQVEQVLEDRRTRAFKENPRIEDRITIGLRVSTFGPLGFGAGYGFTPHLRAEIQYAHQETDIFGSEIDGFHEGTFFEAALVWIPFEAWATFYGSAGIAILSGTFNSFGGFGSASPAGQLDTIYHALALGGGFDIQFEFGLHTRLGLEYRPLLYNQASFEPGVYDSEIQSGLNTWFDEDMGLDLVWLIGWAF